jgi:hypothetical protein
MRLAEGTVLAELQFVWRVLLVFGRGVITTLACATCEGDDISHWIILYQKIALNPALGTQGKVDKAGV